MAAKHDQLGLARGRPGRVRLAQQRPAVHGVLRGLRLRPSARPGELPAVLRRGAVHRRALRLPGRVRRSRAPRSLAGLKAEHVFVLGDDDDLYLDGVAPRAWEPDENATATINYTSGTTARPKGVQITHRNIWTNAVTFALHAGVTDRDVYLHTLPMFHANGWGMPFAMTGLRRAPGRPAQGRRHRDPAPGRGAWRDRDVRRAGRRRGGARRGAAVEGGARRRVPGRDRTRIIVAGAPPPTKTVARVEAELGWEFVQIYGLTETSPLLTVNRTPLGVGRPRARSNAPTSWCARARRRSG